MKERFAERIRQADLAETLVLIVPFMVAHEQLGYARIEFSALLAVITATFSVLVPYVLVVRGVGNRAMTRWLGLAPAGVFISDPWCS